MTRFLAEHAILIVASALLVVLIPLLRAPAAHVASPAIALKALQVHPVIAVRFLYFLRRAEGLQHDESHSVDNSLFKYIACPSAPDRAPLCTLRFSSAGASNGETSCNYQCPDNVLVDGRDPQL